MGVFSSLASAIIGVQSALGGRGGGVRYLLPLGGRGGGVRYLLRDEFTTDRAAGAVNGTAAEPGPGTRTVVDTGNYLSLSGGNAAISGITTGGDPRLLYGGITRLPGVVLLSQFNITAMRFMSGLFSTPTPSAFNHIEAGLADNAGVSYQVVNGAYIAAGSYSTGVSYTYALALRAAGVALFVKGGAYSDWTLIYISASGSTATLYPGLAATTLAASLTSGFFRVPVAKWLPTPLLSDGFGSAFGTSDGLGHAEGVAGGIGAGGSGVTLSNAGGTWSVSGGKAINTPSLGAELLTNGDFSSGTGWTTDTGWSIGSGIATKVASAGVSDVYKSGLAVTGTWYRLIWTLLSRTAGDFSPIIGGVGFVTQNVPATYSYTARGVSSTFLGVRGNATSAGTIDNVSAKALTLSELLTLSNLSCADVYAGAAITKSNTYVQAGLALNWDSASSPANGLIVYLSGGNIVVDKCVAGTWTNVSNTAYTYSAGARLVCTMNAGALRTYYNGALVKVDTIVDAGILTGTYHGLFSTAPDNTLDDLTIYATGTNGEHSQLDSY